MKLNHLPLTIAVCLLGSVIVGTLSGCSSAEDQKKLSRMEKALGEQRQGQGNPQQGTQPQQGR